MFPVTAQEPDVSEGIKKIHWESLRIKIKHTQKELNDLQILSKGIKLFRDEQKTTVEIYFHLTDIIYVNALSRLLNENCFCSEDNPTRLIYTFPYTLDYSSLSMACNFFTSQLADILQAFQETLMTYIVEEAIQEFNLLRGKQFSEKDFRTLKHEVRIADNPVQYVTDIRQIIENAHDAAVCFRNEYNRFFEVGLPILGRISEGANEDEDEDEKENEGEKNTHATDSKGLLLQQNAAQVVAEIAPVITGKSSETIEKKGQGSFSSQTQMFPSLAKIQRASVSNGQAQKRRTRVDSIENPAEKSSTHFPKIK